ncbi:MAG: methyltransferase domain-containing protein [Actinobacteria bacterium]|nr:methyltransferase domain-containing protein [Actinomycetota bacterium]
MGNALEAHLIDQADFAAGYFWHRLRWRFVRRHLPSGRFALLDVGAGTGVVGTLLHRVRPEATYYFDEPIPSMRTSLRRRFGPANDLHGIAEFPPTDVVTLLDVLEHVEDDRGFVATLLGRLEPGTRIVVTVPASMRLWSQWDVALGHHRRYEPEQLAALFDGTAVEITERGRLFPEFVPAARWRARRHPPDTGPGAVGDGGAEGAAEFPRLPRPLNAALYVAGTPSVALSAWMPIGTSLCLVATVRGHRGS